MLSDIGYINMFRSLSNVWVLQHESQTPREVGLDPMGPQQVQCPELRGVRFSEVRNALYSSMVKSIGGK